jgi:CPA2 family monovalent cation:H+ antiporter-2
VIVAAVAEDVANDFISVGVVALVLSALARLAHHLGISAVPLYLLAGLALGEGSPLALDLPEELISFAAEIGVLLLLLMLGLEYTSDELKAGLRTGLVPGAVDAGLNFTPGFVAGLLLGWELPAAILLGGVTWISSSGVISKVLSDLGRLGYRETPSVLNLLVIEDLAMAVYLPVVAALVVGGSAASTVTSVAVALAAVGAVLWGAMRWGHHVSERLARGNDEAILLAVFGLTLLVGGLAQRLQVSAAVGAFVVGLALSGTAQERASGLVEPLRDLFAALFFLFFAFQIPTGDLPAALLPAALLLVVSGLAKVATGWVVAGRAGAAPPGRLRAGTALVARGEFSIVIASLGVGLADGSSLGVLAAAYVLLSAIVGPLAAKHADRLVRFVPAGVGRPVSVGSSTRGARG